MILYFSGTGNSRFAARLIAGVTGEEPVSLNELMRNGGERSFSSEKPYVIVTPTHGWRIPRPVEELLRSCEFRGDRRAYFVMTCGTDTGDAARYIKRLCADMGLEYMGLQTVVMPENYIAMFAVPEAPEAEEIIKRAVPVIRGAAERIGRGEPLPAEKLSAFGRTKSTLVNPVFYKLFVRGDKFRATGDCVGCGKCESLCPTRCVRLVGGRPVWNKSCVHCMACICACPQEAIEYGDISSGKPRYYLTRDPE